MAGPANAASTPLEACGSGYHEIDHQAIKYPDIEFGVIYLMYNGSTDCVVTWKTAYIGKETGVSALVAFTEGKNSKNGVDFGNYKYYAGPVKLSAAGKCILWGGSFGSQKGSAPYGWDSPSTGPRAHCG